MSTLDAQSGRAVAIARRQAMSAGKAALPAPAERARVGFRETAPAQSGGAASVTPALQADQPSAGAAPAHLTAALSQTGRAASQERRQMLSAGKAAIGSVARPHDGVQAALAAGASSRDISRARRVALSQVGGLATKPAEAGRPAEAGPAQSAPIAIDFQAGGGQRVTSSRVGRGEQVTGQQRGTAQPVSGTQYIAVGAGDPARGGGPKVGLARTPGGQTVSGTMVRSAVSVTGDEAGAAPVSGRVDQSPADDLTARTSQGSYGSGQFQRQTNPNGGSAARAGSRERQRDRVAEATEGGVAITGSASGRGGRVTGDGSGASRSVTGNHYLAPARRQADRRVPDPTGPLTDFSEPARAGGLSVAQSWGGQRVTGINMEHGKRVTGDPAGTSAPPTGSQYGSPVTIDGDCEPGSPDTATRRRMRARASKAITGSTVLHADGVTGTGRGAARDITGTSYSGPSSQAGADAPASAASGAVAALDGQFSIRSPQRSAQLSTGREAASAERITGSFAAGGDKLTGNVEFQARRRATQEGREAASTRVSGEGSSRGTAITGNAWSNQGNVTGTGAAAPDRNPTQRGAKAKPLATAATFRGDKQDESKQLVTGLFGSFSGSGARVTLSGGAQT